MLALALGLATLAAAQSPPVGEPSSAAPSTAPAAAPAIHPAGPPVAKPPAVQPPAAGEPAAGPTGPSPASFPRAKETTAALDAARAELDQQDAALRRPVLSPEDLQRLRTRIDPIGERLQAIVDELAPELAAAKARLDQLGQKPKDGEPEAPDAARERAERGSAVAALDGSLKVARSLMLQAEQLTAQISERRRSSFTSALFARSYSLVNPDLWLQTAQAYPRDLRALRVTATSWLDRVRGQSSPGSLLLVGLAIAAAIALQIGRRKLAPRLVLRDPQILEVSRRRRRLAALGVLLVETLPAAAGAFLVYQSLVIADLIPARVVAFVAALLLGIAFLALVKGLIDAVLAPGLPTWRLFRVSDEAAKRLRRFIVAFATALTVGRVVETANQAVAASLSLTVATRAVTVTVAALILAEMLRRFGDHADPEDACLGPYIPTDTQVGSGPARLLGWTLVLAILGGVLAGYVALASFLTDQVAWGGVVVGVAYLAVKLSDEFVGGTLREQTRVAIALQANLGLRPKSLRQIGVLASGITRVVLILAAILLALAPWGIESFDVSSNLRAAFFGFKVGEVTISLSATIIAVLIFGVVTALTRVLQGWLNRTFLPTTELEPGLRNSIVTATGYLGFFVAAGAALSYLGLGLDKIAIVAGALSVGIGFGLQSIVNNFVSGLILLFERPIRVGDLVVVGSDGEGYVRKINVRATEIETFDRSTIIVPNSNLISGIVKNRVRGDRTGRAVVPVNVLRNQDPARAADLMVGIASRHPRVLAEPPPRVMFKKIGETWLEFELIAYVDDATQHASVQSDLNFAVFKMLVDEGILPSLGPGAVNVGGLEPVQEALRQIAGAIAAREEPHADTPLPAEPTEVSGPNERAARDPGFTGPSSPAR